MADLDIRALVATKDSELSGMFESPAMAQRFREAIFQLWADPEQRALRECRPESIVAGFMAVADLGLTLSKQRGHAYLVPFGGTATPMIGYKGLIHLALQCGGALDFRPGVRYEKDQWAINPLSPTQPITHIPADGNRGRKVGYYCVVFLPGGLARAEYMTVAEVEEHRDRYSKTYQKTKKWGFGTFDDMALKTVVRKVCKFLRLSGNFAKAMTVETTAEMVDDEPEIPDDLPKGDAGVDQPTPPPGFGAGMSAAIPPPKLKLTPDSPSAKVTDEDVAALCKQWRSLHSGKIAGFDKFLFDNFGVEDASDLTAEQFSQCLAKMAESNG